MDDKTMEYISRRTERQSKHDEHMRPEYESGRISKRYMITGMENVIPQERKDTRQTGFATSEKEVNLLYELEESLEAEIDDVVYYSEMAMEAEMKGHKEFSNAFYELAKERLACAEFVRLRLIQHGEYDPHKQKDVEERYDRAKHLFRRL